MNLNVEPKDIIDAYSTPIVQQTSFWSKVKEKLGMDWNALLVYQQGQDVWFWLGEENSGRHSFFNLGAWHCLLRSKQLLFRVKKWWLYTRWDIPDWSRVRKATFFTRCISPGSSATHCLIWQRWRLGPLHTDSCAGISMGRNCLHISAIREMLANSYNSPLNRFQSAFHKIYMNIIVDYQKYSLLLWL